jgi:hypothetical protein
MKPIQIVWAEDEVILNEAKVNDSRESEDGKYWHIDAGTKDGRIVPIRFNLQSLLPEKVIRESVQGALRETTQASPRG